MVQAFILAFGIYIYTTNVTQREKALFGFMNYSDTYGHACHVCVMVRVLNCGVHKVN